MTGKAEEKSLVVGMTGSGKSTLVKQLIRPRKRVIVFDPQGEYSREGLATRAASLRDLLGEMQAGWASGFRLSYEPTGGYEAEQLHLLAMLLFRVQAKYEAGVPGAPPITLVVEEMDLSFPSYALPANQRGMQAMCNQGRHYGISCFGVTQYPTAVSLAFRRNAARRYILRLGDSDDQKAMAKLINRPVDEVAAIQKFEYFEWADGYAEKKKIRK